MRRCFRIELGFHHFFSGWSSKKHFDNFYIYIKSPLITASTSYSAPPDSEMLLRSTLGCRSCLHVTTSSLPSSIRHFFKTSAAIKVLSLSEHVLATIKIRRPPGLQSLRLPGDLSMNGDHIQTPTNGQTLPKGL